MFSIGPRKSAIAEARGAQREGLLFRSVSWLRSGLAGVLELAEDLWAHGRQGFGFERAAVKLPAMQFPAGKIPVVVAVRATDGRQKIRRPEIKNRGGAQQWYWKGGGPWGLTLALACLGSSLGWAEGLSHGLLHEAGKSWAVAQSSAGKSPSDAAYQPTNDKVPTNDKAPTNSPATEKRPLDAPLFDGGQVHEFRLDLPAATWATLKRNYLQNTVYEARFTWQGNPAQRVAPVSMAAVGIRSRGAGSRDPRKPSLRIDLDRYQKEQHLLGQTSLVLDNAVQDASYLAERLAQSFFGRMGLPAPRATHARLFVNGEYLGLYVLVERVDERFLQRNFGTQQGDLYEFNRPEKPYRFENRGTDPAAYAPAMFEPKNSKPDLPALVRLIQAINQPADDRYLPQLAEHVDLELLVQYMAVENYLADFDGLTGIVGANNFYLYRRPKDGKFVFVPWDKDYSFGTTDMAVDFGFAGHSLAARLYARAEFRQQYAKQLQRAAEVDGGWLAEEAERVAAMIRAEVEADPYWQCDQNGGICSASKAEAQQLYLFDVVRNRPAFLAEALEEMP